MPVRFQSVISDLCLSGNRRLTGEHDGMLDPEELGQRSLEDLWRRRHFVSYSEVWDEGRRRWQSWSTLGILSQALLFMLLRTSGKLEFPLPGSGLGSAE